MDTLKGMLQYLMVKRVTVLMKTEKNNKIIVQAGKEHKSDNNSWWLLSLDNGIESATSWLTCNYTHCVSQTKKMVT